MAIKYFNIKSKEVRVAETEPHISALWASSDRSPNITQGQDFGWRLAPEVVVELKKIKQDFDQIAAIGRRYQTLPEDVDEKMILQFISDKTSIEDAKVASEQDYTDEYEQEIRRLELGDVEPVIPVTTTTTTMTLAQLKAELAAREAKEAPTTTTTTTKSK